MKNANPVSEAIQVAGSGPKLAKQLGVSARAVYKWRARWDDGITAAVPPDRAIALESVSGISKHRFRPDLWPQDNPRIAPAPQDQAA